MRLKRSLLDVILRHCERAAPEEACGVLSGPAEGEPDDVHELRNVALHPRYRYAFDPEEQLALWRKLEAAGWRPLVVYHSHVGRDARLSDTDTRYALLDRTIRHLIVGLALVPAAEHQVRLWSVMAQGEPIEVPLEILEDGLDTPRVDG